MSSPKQFARLKLILKMLALFACFLLSTPEVKADIVQYLDQTGRVHFVDAPEKVPPEFRSQLQTQKSLPTISRASSGREQLYEKQTYGNLGAGGGGSVEIFVTSWCPHCKNLETYLNSKKIAYTKYDIEQSSKGKKLHEELGGGGVPVVRVKGQVIRGFNPEAIEKALQKKS